MKNDQILSILVQFLKDNGWKLFHPQCAAIAFKMYDSAVGKKQAQIYFDWDEYYWRISGLYESQGSNILSPKSVLIPVGITDISNLNIFFQEFIDNAELAIAHSYAVRLLGCGE